MFKLPKLRYEYSSLEPYIDAQTMKIHHGKHHAAYVSNLNKALEGNEDLLEKPIEKLLGKIKDVDGKVRQTVINNGGGHANHTNFWEIMSPKPKKAPEGNLIDAINSSFGNLETFKEKFTEKAMAVFGSGWAFLVVTADKKLKLKRQSFQNSPLLKGNAPVIGVDVWEHAYYLKYQNKRNEYINAWWNVLDWAQAEKNFKKAIG